MPAHAAPIELTANDINRIWQLTLHMYDEEEHVTDVFVAAMQIYREVITDLAGGGGTFEDGEHEWVSSMLGEKIVFTPRPKPPAPPEPEKKAKKDKKDKKDKKG